MFTKALLASTYQDGRPGKLTVEHAKAEHHRFKSDFLFKDIEIPKAPYVSRLIQQFLIIKALERQLQKIPGKETSDISAFFALSYLDELWRTPVMEKDLQLLGIDPDHIDETQVTKSTKAYLKKIDNLPPKMLLAHFLLHVAGFMQGGNIINTKYLAPHNKLMAYKIPDHQYDFSSATSFFSKPTSTIGLFNDMMKHIDTIPINDEEYEEIFKECTGVYSTMSDIYDDLCAMHTRKSWGSALAITTICLLGLLCIVKIMQNYMNASTSTSTLGLK